MSMEAFSVAVAMPPEGMAVQFMGRGLGDSKRRMYTGCYQSGEWFAGFSINAKRIFDVIIWSEIDPVQERVAPGVTSTHTQSSCVCLCKGRCLLAKKMSLASRTRLAVIRSMFTSAGQAASRIGNQQIVNAINGVGVLDNPTGQQADDVLGLIDGVLELERLYGNIVKTERVEAAGSDDADEVDEVCSTKAREPLPSEATTWLIQTRVWVSAASVLLHNQDRPVSATAPVPAPGAGGQPEAGTRRATRIND